MTPNIHITGIGCVSSLGEGVDTFIRMVEKSPLSPEKAFSQAAIEDTVFYQGRLSEKTAVSAFELSLVSCQMALRDSNMTSGSIGLVVATGAGDTKNIENGSPAHDTAYRLAEQVGRALGITGMFCQVSNACSSAGYALTTAESLLENGHDAVLLCGVEAKSITSQATFKSLLVLDPVSCRPFEDDRKGTVLGAGAAALVLTKDVHGPGYAEILGLALNSDACHITSPEPTGRYLEQCITEALHQAGLLPGDIDLFVPHATGTRLNDEIEQMILKKMFKRNFTPESTGLLKKHLGHTGGGSAAFSYVYAASRLGRKRYHGDGGRRRFSLVNCTGFGGGNSSVIFGATDPDRGAA